MFRRALGLAALVALLAAAPASALDWRTFGYDSARSGVFPGPTGIGPANLATLGVQAVQLPGVVDSAPLYLAALPVAGGVDDVFVVTTSYGRTFAVDAATGALLWRFDPAGIAGWEGGKRITEATPVIDPERRFVYAAAPDGSIHKLSLADGSEEHDGAWPVPVTRDPGHEKIGAALNLDGRYVYAATTSFADGKPYQGHVVAIDRVSGATTVFNALCGGSAALLDPSRCGRSGSSIWGRGGVVVEPGGGGRLLVATANGLRRGRTDWGESVLEMAPGAARVLRAWTPSNPRRLDELDLDLGSAAPAPIRYGSRLLALQGSKDGIFRLLDVRRLGQGRSRGVLQTFSAPNHASVRTAPVAWTHGGAVTVFSSTNGGTVAYGLTGGSRPRLKTLWRFPHGGTSPVLAGGLLYSFDQLHGVLNVLEPAHGRLLRSFALATGHWNSPVVADGRVAIGTGNANLHQTAGVLWILRGR